MPTRAETNAKAAALRATFEAAGAQAVEPPILQSADTLLDLYGEDIRARAYVTSDALRGEQMLRPDFTVPVVEMHMAHGAEPARYTYAGEVFRRQESDPERANEYVQVGYEVFDREDPAKADAEVFSLIAGALKGLSVTAVVGDIALLMAAVDGLPTSEPRKAALRRHIWRPTRFRALLDRFAGLLPVPASRVALLADETTSDAPFIGRRSLGEIETRVAALKADADVPPISESDVSAITKLLEVRAPLTEAIKKLEDLVTELPAIGSAVVNLSKRADALEERGVDTSQLAFDAGYGRETMEYYDGFVFGFHADAQPSLPAIATGGRYDALTKQLGRGEAIPAVGGVMRPGLMLKLEGAK